MNLEKQKLIFVNNSPFPDPEYAHTGDSCFDARAWLQDDITGSDEAGEYYDLKPFERHIFHTGYSFIIPEHCEIQARTRSGCASKLGLIVLNSPATIDSRYRGEVGIIAINLSNEVIRIYNGDRIAQMGLYPVYDSTLVERVKTDYIDPTQTDRGALAYGSSGMK